MDEKTKSSYDTLKEFWDNAFKLSDEDKKQILSSIIKEDDYISLAPSPKLYEAVKSISEGSKFLDYGCGNGWASIIAGINKAKEVIGVDVSKNSIEYANILKHLFAKDANIIFKEIDNEWLKNEQSESYDSIYSSNVFDVIPTSLAISLKRLKSIVLEYVDAPAIIIFGFSFNAKVSGSEDLELLSKMGLAEKSQGEIKNLEYGIRSSIYEIFPAIF